MLGWKVAWLSDAASSSLKRQSPSLLRSTLLPHDLWHLGLSQLSPTCLFAACSAVRAQQFVAFTRQDLELRKAKAAALEREVYPDHTKGGWRRSAVVALESLAGNYELVSRDRSGAFGGNGGSTAIQALLLGPFCWRLTYAVALGHAVLCSVEEGGVRGFL
jgi:hypothetical protein